MAIRRNAFIIAIMIGTALAASGCGRKGPLLTPSQANAIEASKADGKYTNRTEEPAEKEREDKPFILDPLIE